MIRPQKTPIRPVYNQSTINETMQSSTNVGDINSYLGKILLINHHQVLVEEVLGQGGFAFVFLVRSSNQQRYALKRMYVNNRRDLNVCQREITLVKEFSFHPNIVKYVDSSIQRSSPRRYFENGDPNNNNEDEDDAIYEILLLTEYCSNGPLITRLNEQRIYGKTLSERHILRIFADICNAVSACHHRPQPVLHRDIKLENILIDSQQNTILCDFGSAIILSCSTGNDFQQYQTNQLTTHLIQQLTEDIQRYTTLSYRAPEMVDLFSRLPITLRTDIWAMGCLLYKLMYNTMPFGDSILAIQNGIFVIPDDMIQVYSRDLNLFVRYILEIDIKKRPDIWQVSYMTYKLLGMKCPIANRCQSKIPDLSAISMPLTDTESRQQRKAALSKPKSTSTNITIDPLPPGTAVNPRERPRGMITPSTSTNIINDPLSFGTTVNPRERPRAMIAPSTSLINFNQQSPVPAAPPPLLSNPPRSGSAAQLLFDDDFLQSPSHAASLNNIPTVTTTTTTSNNEPMPSRARPSPPTSISPASGLSLQQRSFPPPPSSNAYTHRRSASQTITPTNIQSSFHEASSVDLPIPNEIFYDEETCLPKSDDDKSLSPNMKSTNHHPSSEEAEKIISMSNKNSRSSIEQSSISQNESPTIQLTNFDDNCKNRFHQLVNEDSDDEQMTSTNERNNQTNPSSIDHHNPFLRAPFHHSPANKQISIYTFDPNSIILGKRTSAFTPYQKNGINTSSHSELSSTDVFTNAPFKRKSKNKQPSTTTTNDPKKMIISDTEPRPTVYSNISFNNPLVDEHF